MDLSEVWKHLILHRSQTGVLALLPPTAVWIYFVLHRSQTIKAK